MSVANRRTVHKDFRLDPAQINRAKKALGASTETETIIRALDLVINESARNRLAIEASQRLLQSGILIHDAFGSLGE